MIMKFSQLIAIGALLLSTACQAQWISDVDKKYQAQFPDLYADVAKAKVLIEEAQGDTAKIRQAIGLLVAVAEKEQNLAPAYVELGRASLDLGIRPNNNFDPEALQASKSLIQRALKIEPDYDSALALMGYIIMFEGKLDEAEKYFAQIQAKGSKYPLLNSHLAQLANRRGNYRLALDYALQGYELNKSTPRLAAGAITEILFAYQKLPENTIVEEEKWFAKRRELVPSAWNWQAHASFRLYRLGDHKAAIEFGTKALSIMNFGAGRFTLAAAHYKNWNALRSNPGTLDEANKSFDIARNLYPDTDKMIRELLAAPNLKSTGEALSMVGSQQAR